MSMFFRLLIGGNLGLFVENIIALIGSGLLGALVVAVGTVLLKTKHYRIYRTKSDSVVAYIALQFLLSAIVIIAVALAIKYIK